MYKVVCIGGVNKDHKATLENAVQYYTSNPAKITLASGGVARNVAENLIHLQCSVSLITLFGKDADGVQLRRELQTMGIDCQHSHTLSDKRTGNYIHWNDIQGETILAAADMEIFDHFKSSWLEEAWSDISKADMVFLDTNLPAESVIWLIQQAKKMQLPLSLDPVSASKAKKLPEELNGISLLFPDTLEAETITGLSWDGAQSCEKMWRQLSSRGLEALVLSMGKKGIYAASRQGCQILPALSVRAKDVTGAGDALAAGVIWGVMQNLSLFDACRAGLRNAALTVQTEKSVLPGLRSQLLK